MSTLHHPFALRQLQSLCKGLLLLKGAITVTSAEGPVSAPSSVVAKAVPKVEPVVTKSLPEPKQSQGVAVPKERDTAVAVSAPPSRPLTPPSSIPPPPQHPPPTVEELAAQASSVD